MKYLIIVLALLAFVPAVEAKETFSNTVFMVWTNKAQAEVSLAQINAALGLPKYSYINGKIATNCQATITYGVVETSVDKHDNIVYTLPMIKDAIISDLTYKPKKAKLKKQEAD
jgi:hypothetical protein